MMRRYLLSLLFPLVVLGASPQMAAAQVTPYNFYWGDMHAHSSYSDGVWLPGEVYEFARDTAHLDFFALTDHDRWPTTLTQEEYDYIVAQADAFDEPGWFVALYGVEWTPPEGHINFYMSPTPQMPDDLCAFYQTISEMGLLAHFNHPQEGDFAGFHYMPEADLSMAMVEVRDGWEELSYIAMLDAGWHVAPVGCEDKHDASWGMGPTWTVALAGELTREAILDSLWSRRVYSTADRNLQLTFTMDGALMGSQIERLAGTSICTVEVADPDESESDAIERIDLFLDGEIVDSVQPCQASYAWTTSVELTPVWEHYCFVRVTQADGGMTWSSPIWFTITDAPLPPEPGPPVIEDIQIDRGRDSDAPDWPCYHERVTVRAVDPDGASDIVCVEITDSGGEVHQVSICWGEGWQEDDYTIGCEWSEWSLLEAPPPGPYIVTVYDWSGNSDTLTTPPAPEVSEVHPDLLSPPMDTVIYDPLPTFEWTEGIPGSSYTLRVEEEGTWGDIWSADLGAATSALYNFDGSASSPELQPNHSYFWCVESWYPDDDRVSDPRVAIWTAQHTRGRFTLYGDWPALPPELPGKFAYGVSFWGWDMQSIMGYNTDPHSRVWLGPDWAGSPDWSPDGSRLLYSKHPGIWIDPVDGSPPVQVPGISGSGCRWAPDGTRISYWSQVGPAGWYEYEVRVANTDGSDDRVVSPETTRIVPHQEWSPDGLWISYRGRSGLELVRYDGTQHQPLTATGLLGHPECGSVAMGEHAWSPDGKRLAVVFVAYLPGETWPNVYLWGLGVISREGGLVTPVFLAPPGVVCCPTPRLPRWSPDGTKIVFTSGHHLPDPPGWGIFEPRTELWMVNADGSGNPVRLTYDNSMDFYISWWAPNTDPGADVSVTKGDTTVTFETVTDSGSTTVCVTDEPSAETPQGFQFLGDYYDISTDATYAGTITIEIHYDDADVPGGQEEWLSLLHWEVDHWVDITVRPIDTVNNIIRGECTSLSVVGIAFGPQFQGLLPPINNDGSSIFKLNRTVPVKFQVIAPDGSFVTDALAKLYLAEVSDDVIGTYDEAESTGKADWGNTFRYDPEANQYIFNLGTKGLSTGTWVLQIVINDLATKEVWVSLR